MDAALPVKQGDTAILLVESQEPPQTLSMSFYPLGTDSPSKSQELGSGVEVEMKLDIPPGTYNVAVFGRWPSGDVTYEFRLDVTPQ